MNAKNAKAAVILFVIPGPQRPCRGGARNPTLDSHCVEADGYGPGSDSLIFFAFIRVLRGLICS